jgi:hypothetical protein
METKAETDKDKDSWDGLNHRTCAKQGTQRTRDESGYPRENKEEATYERQDEKWGRSDEGRDWYRQGEETEDEREGPRIQRGAINPENGWLQGSGEE